MYSTQTWRQKHNNQLWPKQPEKQKPDVCYPAMRSTSRHRLVLQRSRTLNFKGQWHWTSKVKDTELQRSMTLNFKGQGHHYRVKDTVLQRSRTLIQGQGHCPPFRSGSNTALYNVLLPTTQWGIQHTTATHWIKILNSTIRLSSVAHVSETAWYKTG